jgi:hypothetical protein
LFLLDVLFQVGLLLRQLLAKPESSIPRVPEHEMEFSESEASDDDVSPLTSALSGSFAVL